MSRLASFSPNQHFHLPPLSAEKDLFSGFFLLSRSRWSDDRFSLHRWVRKDQRSFDIHNILLNQEKFLKTKNIRWLKESCYKWAFQRPGFMATPSSRSQKRPIHRVQRQPPVENLSPVGPPDRNVWCYKLVLSYLQGRSTRVSYGLETGIEGMNVM